MIRAALAFLLILPALPAMAMLDCRDTEYRGNGYAVCIVDSGAGELRLFLNDARGAPYGQFGALAGDLAARGERLLFAMNAGMYHADRSPVGHYVENGDVLRNVVPGAGPGNFGLVPNGIFCITDTRADVIETETFLARRPACRHATQSGPMLVIDGALHPRFLPDSTSRYIRNGVGTTADGKTAVFVISANPVTFHEFGTLFRDALGLPNALYFDGNVSRLYAPDLGRHDRGRMMGPIVGLVAPRP